jgi:hypothetical protein
VCRCCFSFLGSVKSQILKETNDKTNYWLSDLVRRSQGEMVRVEVEDCCCCFGCLAREVAEVCVKGI